MVCFNRPLAERMRARAGVGTGGHINTFYGFCHAFLEDRGQILDFSAMGSDSNFWIKVQERVTAEDIPSAWKFDTLIVDEGQDFESEWLEILKLFLNDEVDMLWLEDPDQNLQSKPTVETTGFVRYRSPVNYRSPESITRFIRNTLPFSFDAGNHLPGLGVGVHAYSYADEQPRMVGKIIVELMRSGFSHEDIVLLTCRGIARSIFNDIEQVGGLPLRKFTGEYDSNGNQVLSNGRLTFESIYRFKGQQAPAVIVVDVDPNPERLLNEQRLLYCSLTRATVRIDMLVNKKNPENLHFLDQR